MPRAQANILVKLFFRFLGTTKLLKISSSISTILCILTLIFLFHTSQSPTLFRIKNSSKNTEDPVKRNDPNSFSARPCLQVDP